MRLTFNQQKQEKNFLPIDLSQFQPVQELNTQSRIIIIIIFKRKNKMININNKVINQQENETEPLIVVPQANLAIYPDRIHLYSQKKDNSISAVNMTISNVYDGEAKDKVIPFKSDFAFKIDEKKRKIYIIAINPEKIQFEFTVQKESQLIIIQGILRRKMCEMGFEEQFNIIEFLGKGAMAKVYLVQRFSDKKLFAAKIISIKQASNKQYESFINEAKILKSLKNPYIIAIESIYISKKMLICVVEYLQGGTLSDQLRDNGFKTARQKLKIIKDVAQGLEHLRQKRIVHRDLKLDNIMVRINKDKSKDYVIADFGFACWIGDKNLLYQKCGTPGYVAPEILRTPLGKIIVSHLSDVFSFGVICHFILLQKEVFPDSGNCRKNIQNNGKAKFSLSTNSHLALMGSQQQLLKKTLEIDPQKRISAEQIVKFYIPNYQKQLILQENKKKRVLSNQKEKQQKNEIKNKRHRTQLKSSIQIIQKRPPSMKKQYFSNRMKTEEAKSVQKQQRGDSMRIFLGKVWNKISRSNTEALKKKQEPPSRKKQMKYFIM